MTRFRIRIFTGDGVVITLPGDQNEEDARQYMIDKLAGSNLIVPSEKGFTLIPWSHVKRIAAERINDE